jgi:hypothetical protein
MSEPLPTWTVQGMIPDVRFTPGTGPVEGMTLTFVTSSGVTGPVFVPTPILADTNRIAALIQQRVAELHAIHTLSG